MFNVLVGNNTQVEDNVGASELLLQMSNSYLFYEEAKSD